MINEHDIEAFKQYCGNCRYEPPCSDGTCKFREVSEQKFDPVTGEGHITTRTSPETGLLRGADLAPGLLAWIGLSPELRELVANVSFIYASDGTLKATHDTESKILSLTLPCDAGGRLTEVFAAIRRSVLGEPEGFGLAQLTHPNPADTLDKVAPCRGHDMASQEEGMKYVDKKHVLDILAEFKAKRATLDGCYDRFCYITGPRKGQVTNGGCRCLHNQNLRSQTQTHQMQKVAHWIQDMITKLENL